VFNDTNIQPYFEFANYFKDIFKLFSKVLITNNKKQQLTHYLRQWWVRAFLNLSAYFEF